MDLHKLKLFKNKDEHAQSAIASLEVREHLAGFIRSKRQGSCTQIDSIQQQQQQKPQLHQQLYRPFDQSSGNSGGSNSYYVASLLGTGTQDDDHPLRKTASMPTMHVQYKAPSSSRRRQIERRTTLNPLIGKNSRPKKQIPRSVDSDSTDYSSNPLRHSSRPNTRSQSRNSSPPPQDDIVVDIDREINQQTQAGGQSSDPTPTPQPTNEDLEIIQNNLKDSLQFSRCHSSTTDVEQQLQVHQQQQTLHYQQQQQDQLQHQQPPNQLLHQQQQHKHKQQISSSPLIVAAKTITRNKSTNTTDGIFDAAKMNETKKAIVKKVASKGLLTIGGSLDIEGYSAPPSKRGDTNHKKRLDNGPRVELRQWSLDGADLKTNKALNDFVSDTRGSSGLALASNVFPWELYKHRLATTKDAAVMKRSQLPGSSISMGFSGSQVVATMSQSQPHQQQPQGLFNTNSTTNSQHYPFNLRDGRVPLSYTHIKQFSSSSSSTSSQLSPQDSLEESSSQAIDLSSSSEAGRQKYQKQQSDDSMFAKPARRRSQLASHLTVGPTTQRCTPSKGKHYQCVLQESFNQLQLCQSQERMKQLLLSQPEPLQAHQSQIGSSPKPNHLLQQHPSLMNTSRTAGSLDASSNQGNLMASQFNLSASAQNLVSPQEQQHAQGTRNNLDSSTVNQYPSHAVTNSDNIQPIGQHYNDLNQWMVAYNNLLQPSELQQHLQLNKQQPNLIDKTLLSRIISLPEPYKSTMLNQLILEHETHTPASLADNSGCPEMAPRPFKDLQQSGQLKCRALSSPMLISDMDTPMPPVNSDYQNRSGDYPAASALSANTIQQPNELLLSQVGSRQQKPFSQITDMVVDAPHEESSQLQHSVDMKSRRAVDNSTLNPRVLGQSNEKNTDLLSERVTVNFNYTPIDPKKASCSYIYNPVFDKHSKTGITYELEMCNHKCICANENNHPENSYRILAIWRRLFDKGLMAKCAKIDARSAHFEEIKFCHSATYTNYFGKSPFDRIKLINLDLSKLPIKGLTQLECGGQGADVDTAWNEEQTPRAARLAAGCVIESAVSVATGKLMNAFAIVRPPGHHAEYQQAMGFCFFNSVAIATRVLVNKHRLSRILIVDWDIHHGNGIQKTFYEDKNVMYISLHRYDKGKFYPGTGDIKEVGEGSGKGFNWNIAWSGEVMGDAEYMAAYRAIVMPIARDYNPSIVLVACGFDAARGHPFNFGGYDLSPACFAYMTRQLMTLASGRLVLCLEGGYQLDAICDCAESCVRVLLNESYSADYIHESELRRVPNPSARDLLSELSNLAMSYWPSVGQLRSTIGLSALDALTVS